MAPSTDKRKEYNMIKSSLKCETPKIVKSLGCPYCHTSSDVTHKEIYTKDHEEISWVDNESRVAVYKKVYKCHCNSCKRDYTVDYGYDRYVIFDKPFNQASFSVDNELLAMFESDSERNYEIIKGNLKGNPIYFIIYEEDPYPIFISESKLDDYIYNVKTTQSLIFSTWMNRYR